jgi:DNA-binding NarL/FixJ family response regulator
MTETLETMEADTGAGAGGVAEIRVVVVDDHTLMRQGLVGILEQLCKFRVVGEAGDGFSAIAVTRQVKPHVVLMDVSMPGMTGAEATRQILAEMPGVKVVALTMHHSEEMRQVMKTAGAAHFLSKSADAADVCAAIRRVVEA